MKASDRVIISKTCVAPTRLEPYACSPTMSAASATSCGSAQPRRRRRAEYMCDVLRHCAGPAMGQSERFGFASSISRV